jgi:hypothetical protein
VVGVVQVGVGVLRMRHHLHTKQQAHAYVRALLIYNTIKSVMAQGNTTETRHFTVTIQNGDVKTTILHWNLWSREFQTAATTIHRANMPKNYISIATHMYLASSVQNGK